MANETTEILRLVLDADQAIKKTADLKKQRDALIDTNKVLAITEGKNSEAALKNDAAIKILNQEIAKQTKETNNLVKAQLAAEGSNDQLKAQLSILTAQYNALSKAERETSVVGKAYADQINVITEELKGTEGAIGNFRRNVGDYEGAIKRAGTSLTDLKNRLAEVQKVAQTTDINTQEFKDARDEAANLGLQIGQLEGKLDEFGNREPKNPAKKAFEDTVATAVTLGSTLELVNLAFSENEDVQASVAQSLKAIAIAQQLANIAKEAGAIIDTIALAKSSALAAANFVLAGSTTLLTTITTAFGTASAIAWAIATLGAAALVAGIILVVKNFDELLTAVTDFIGLTSEQDRAANKLNESYASQLVTLRELVAAEEQRGETVSRVFDRQIKLQQSLGRDTVELEKQKAKAYQQTLLAQNDAARKAADIIKKSNSGTAKEYQDLLKTIQENNNKLADSTLEIQVIENQANLKRVEEQKKTGEKLSAENKKINDKAREDRKKYLEDIQKLEDEFLLNDREKVAKGFDDKLLVIKGKSEEEIKLRQAIEKAKKEALDTFDAESAAASLAKEQKRAADILAVEAQLFNEQQSFLTKQLELELAAVDLSVGTEQEKADKKLKIQLASLEQQLALTKEFVGADGIITKEELQGITAIEQAIAKAKQGATKKEPATFGAAVGLSKEDTDALATSIQQISQNVAAVQGAINDSYTARLANIDSTQKAETDAINASTLSEAEKKTKIDKLNRDTAKKKYDLELKQFNTNKAFQVAQTIIAGAQGIVAAFQLGPIAGAIAAAVISGVTLAQLSIIQNSTPPTPPSFAGGVVSMMGAGNGTSDSIPSWLSRGESVITEQGTNLSEQINPGYLAWLNKPNKFATGLDPIQSSFIPPQQADIGQQIREAMAGLTIVTKVTDIDKAQIDRRQVREVSVI